MEQPDATQTIGHEGSAPEQGTIHSRGIDSPGPGRRPEVPRRLLSPVALGLMVSALTAGFAYPAAQQAADPERAFEALKRRFDKNFDGKLSSAEWTRNKRAFRRLDKDKDGLVTKAEFLDAAAARNGTGKKTEKAPTTPAKPAETGPVAAVTPEAAAFFESKIRPVLSRACYSCHSDRSSKVKGGLRVDSLSALLQGGHGGPGIVPGDADASALIEAVRYEDPLFAMPPKGKLDDEEIADLEAWVRMGAPWPSAGPAAEMDPGMAPPSGVIESGPSTLSLNRDIDIEEGRRFWSFQPIERPEPPTPVDGDWALNEVDRFLRASQEAAGVSPVVDAADSTWLRRVTFDLTGLPPTPIEIDMFDSDQAPGRHERVVDRLLASDGFGERFGRHWLDVARYGESSGKERNVVYPHAWRYRDWVIEAMSSDMPYDEFLMKQIAGDLLPASDPNERARNMIATGYLAIGTKSHGQRDKRKFTLDLVDEQIDALSQGVFGLTVSCARCHDHKFDPIPTDDYYALAGILMSSETLFGTLSSPGNNQTSDLLELPKNADLPNGPRMDERIRRLLSRANDRSMQNAEKAEAKAADSMGEEAMSADAKRDARRQRRNADQRANVVNSLLDRFDERGRALPANLLAMGMAEGTPVDLAVLDRGEIDRPKDVAKRGFPQVLTGPATPSIGSGSGRLELAEWIVSPEHPLTARVWANRVWLHLFGKGIVRTPDNFGAGGTAPDHPELLDWLASELIESGWSTKSLVRTLVLSRAYRLDSAHDGKAHGVDPDVLTLWRMPERRLEAEAIRDAMLSASGTLSKERPVGSPTGAMEGALRNDTLADLLTKEVPVRSVYMPVLRGHATDSMDAFDAPDAAVVAGSREVTTVATQALYLMNDNDVLKAADAFADRLLGMDVGDSARIERAFELALGRTPSGAERGAVSSFLKAYERDFDREVEANRKQNEKANGGNGKSDRQNAQARRRARLRERAVGAAGEQAPPIQDARRAAWSAFTQSLFQCAEFRALG